MRIEAISTGRNPPHEVNVIVEVPVGGEPIKYEMDKDSGALVVDRFLYTPMRYPGNYGFVPHTLSDDGDPIDVLIANQRGIIPGAVIAVRPVGVLKMRDESGGDEKMRSLDLRCRAICGDVKGDVCPGDSFYALDRGARDDLDVFIAE